MSTVAPVAVPDDVARALRAASRETGTGFDYLVQTAMRESGLDAAASAPTSSAVGLFQFIERTWMETVKETGPRHGLGEAAAAIEKTPSGGYEVADPALRAAILALRTDPRASAMMAGELARSNAESLTEALGRAPSEGELYIAHFLGAGGAARLIAAAGREPDSAASTLFPAAARANPSIFTRPDGSARSVAEVYRNLVRRHGQAAVVVAREGPIDITPDRARAGLAPRGAAEGGEAAREGGNAPAPLMAAAYAAPERPFHDLFRGGEAPSPQLRLAALRAYGLTGPGPGEGRGFDRPARTFEPADPAGPAPAARPARPLWGGGLFTNAAPRPMAAEGGLFTTPGAATR